MLRRLVRSVVPVPVRVALLQWPSMVSLWRLDKLPRGEVGAHVLAQRTTPLRREKTAYAESFQRAKEQNVRRAAELLDGVTVPPGALFSWHRELGPPVRLRGFASGPELHDDQLAAGGGGGLCQVANLMFFLAVNAGLELVERHRHTLDLFPDDARTVPFGCGATVFFPKKDLRFRNPHDVPVAFSLRIVDRVLEGAATSTRDLGFRCEILERDHRIEEHDGVRTRSNSLFRRWKYDDGASRDEWLFDNSARVAWLE